MSWSKIKNIMIIILAVINVFLFADISMTRHASKELPKSAGENFAAILEKKNITVEKNLVPKYYETRDSFSVSMYTLDELSKMFLGKSVAYAAVGNSFTASVDDKTIEADGAYIKFSAKGKETEKNGDDILKKLKKLGLDTKGAVYDEKEGRVKRVFSNLEIAGVYLDVTLGENGEIIRAEGIWPQIDKDGKNEKVSIMSTVIDISNRLPENSHISDIKEMYAFEYTDNTPKVKNAWRITTKGKSYLVSE